MIEHDSQDIVVLGLPYDRNSSYLRGTALAPARIREALFSESANMWTENGIDLGEMAGWQFSADLTLDDPQAAFGQIERKIANLLDQNSQVISLGGDHSITYPIIRAYRRHFSDLSILQLDAHPDLYDVLDGNRLSHACPFARIMEEKLVQRLVQVGIRTLTGHQRQQADRFGVEIIEMRAIDKVDQLNFTGPVYLSLDMDCLDPAFAPGTGTPVVGGLSTSRVLRILQGIADLNIVGFDLVEVAPAYDQAQVTALAGASLALQFLYMRASRG